jgi:hypothetical protein
MTVDDVLDALDGLPSGRWNDEDTWLFAERTAHAKAALTHCGPLIVESSLTRFNAVLDALDDLEAELRRTVAPCRYATVNRLPAVLRLRDFWTGWGPVPRLPGVTERHEPCPDPTAEPRPRRRDNFELTWRTL